MIDFVAFDFETADSANSAPCSLGYAVVRDGVIVDQGEFLINPETDFNPYAVRIHKITPEMVQDKPTFPSVWKRFSEKRGDLSLVAHNASFDMKVLEKAACRYRISLPNIECFCTMLTAKDLLNLPNYKLRTVANALNVSLIHHHNACEDAVACAAVMIELMKIEDNRDYSSETSNKPQSDEPPEIDPLEMMFNENDQASLFDAENTEETFNAWMTDILYKVLDENTTEHKHLVIRKNKGYTSVLYRGSTVFTYSFSEKKNWVMFPMRYAAFMSLDRFITARKDDKKEVIVKIRSLNEAKSLSDAYSIALDEAIDSGPREYSCCSRYQACSDAGYCVNPYPFISIECRYKINLKHGRNFYKRDMADSMTTTHPTPAR